MDAGRNTAEVRGNRGDVGGHQDDDGHHQPRPAEPLLNDLAEAFVLDRPDPGGHGLHRHQQRHGEDRHPQQPVAGGGAGHGVGRDAGGVVIGRARDQAGTELTPPFTGPTAHCPVAGSWVSARMQARSERGQNGPRSVGHDVCPSTVERDIPEPEHRRPGRAGSPTADQRPSTLVAVWLPAPGVEHEAYRYFLGRSPADRHDANWQYPQRAFHLQEDCDIHLPHLAIDGQLLEHLRGNTVAVGEAGVGLERGVQSAEPSLEQVLQGCQTFESVSSGSPDGVSGKSTQ